MINTTANYKTAVNAAKRQLKAKAELFSGSSLVATYTESDKIKSITIERVGEESKFFGFGVAHKFNIKLIDVERAINLSTDNYFKINIGVVLASGSVEYVAFPKAFITEVNRDENTNELSITAYDALDIAKTFTVSDLELATPYTIRDVINSVAGKIGASAVIPELDVFNLSYEDGANFEGSESLDVVLKAAAEATQTIYFINGNDALVFKRLDKDGAAVKSIDKNIYITLNSKTNKRLQTICNATELGDNVHASTSEIGSTQYIRDNAFLELREDIATLIDNAVAAVGNITINQFDCDWRGDPSMEAGDKIAFITKDNKTVISYLLNDSLVFDGALNQKTEWTYTESEETESNPTSLGDIINQTFAKVDKANKQIEITASETAANKDAISTLQINTESVNASVQKLEETTTEALDDVNSSVSALSQRVDATVTAEDVKIEIQSELANGVSSVKTSTGFTLDDNGLHISKTGREMSSSYTEDGILIKRDDEDRLKVNNDGVWANNLHATTYLIVGTNSRLEDYEKNGKPRTGCFWIGESEVE